jgi:hypothetical protein
VDVLLISGLWLPSSIWTEVIEALMTLGHRTRAVRLPGVDGTPATAMLEDQVRAVVMPTRR